jgi:NADH dehydrogenase FAD-containing subunit
MGNDMEQVNRWVILQRLRVAEIRMETNLKVEKITGDGIVGVRDGSTVHVNGDSVVLAAGMKAERGLAKELEGKVELHLVGDCREPRRIEQAIDEGFRAGLQT